MSVGVDNLKAVVALGLHLGELIDSLSDGVGLSDIGPALRVAKSVKPAIDAVGGGKLVAELKDLSDEEKAELKAFVESEFDISNDNLEQMIEKAIGVVVDLSDIVKGL